MDASWLTLPWKQQFEGDQSTDGGLGFPQGHSFTWRNKAEERAQEGAERKAFIPMVCSSSYAGEVVKG